MSLPSEKQWWIYKITSPSGRIYIGVTSNLLGRISRYKGGRCDHQKALLHSINKYGFENHLLDVIDQFVSTIDFALGKEMFWIRSFMSNHHKHPEYRGMNLTDGGQGSIGRKLSDETKAKLRAANLGKRYSDETKMKLSEMRKGRKIKSVWTEERKEKMRELKKDFRHTEEAKAKIAAAGIGNKYCVGKKISDEQKAKISAFHKGNKWNLGRRQSPETIAKRFANKRNKSTEIKIQ